jgi:hypothetical protein
MAAARMDARRDTAAPRRAPPAAPRSAPVAAPPVVAAASLQQRIGAAAAVAVTVARVQRANRSTSEAASPPMAREPGREAAAPAAPVATSVQPGAAAPVKETEGGHPLEGKAVQQVIAKAAGGSQAPAGARGAGAEAAQAEGAPAEGLTLEDVKTGVRAAARVQRRPGPSGKLAGQAHDAAQSQKSGGDIDAAEGTLDQLEGAGKDTTQIEKEAFKKALWERLVQLMPDSLKSPEQLGHVFSDDTPRAAGAAMHDELGRQKSCAVGALPATIATPDNPQDHQPQPPPSLLPTSPGPRPAMPGAVGAAPPRAPDAALDTSEDRADADAQMASENLTQPQLKRSNEPSFVDAAETRDKAEEHSVQGAAQVRTNEATLRQGAIAKGASLLNAGANFMAGARGLGFLQAFAKQGAAKTKEQLERERIGDRLQSIQRQTRADVGRILDDMENAAEALFNVRLILAFNAFTVKRNEIENSIRAREEGEARSDFNLVGVLVARWGDLDDDQVEAAISGARQAYNASLSAGIDIVADRVAIGLVAAKKRIAHGKAEAKGFVDGLNGTAKTYGVEALSQIDTEFEAMSAEVDARRDGLIDRLGQSYATAQHQLEESIQAFRDANKSWWQKLKEKIRGVIDAIRKIKDLFFSILSRVAGIIGDILSDPGGFVHTLVEGAKQGFANFRDRIGEHLKEAVFHWVFGELNQTGIELPKQFDAKGIFGFIASILGLTYANIRARAVRMVGEPTARALEAGAEIFRTLMTGGLAGLWDLLSDKLDTIKEQAIDFLKELLITKVIKAGVVWVLSLFNPVSGFIKACKAIYDIVMFFVERAAQIVELVNAILDGLEAVVAGNVAAVAKRVEDALASGLSLVIGQLASLLGLSNMGAAIRSTIERIQAPINKAIDWLIGKAVSLVKTVGGAITGALKGGKEQHPDDPEKEAKLQAGLKDLHDTCEAESKGRPMSKAAAMGIAAGVKKRHPVFSSINVVEEAGHWDFDYRASSGRLVGPLAGLTPETIIVAKVKAYEKLVEQDKMFEDQAKEVTKALNEGKVIKPEPDKLMTPVGVNIREQLEQKKQEGEKQEPTTIVIKLRGTEWPVRYTGGTNIYVYGLGTYGEILDELNGRVPNARDRVMVTEIIANPGSGESIDKRKSLEKKYPGLTGFIDKVRILREIAELARSRMQLVNVALNKPGQGPAAVTTQQPVAPEKFAATSGRAEKLAGVEDPAKSASGRPTKPGTDVHKRLEALLDNEVKFLEERVKNDPVFPISKEEDLVDFFVTRVMEHLKKNA